MDITSGFWGSDVFITRYSDSNSQFQINIELGDHKRWDYFDSRHVAEITGNTLHESIYRRRILLPDALVADLSLTLSKSQGGATSLAFVEKDGDDQLQYECIYLRK